MSSSDSGVDRRSVMKAISATAATASLSGIGSGKSSSQEGPDSDVTELQMEYADIEVAKSILRSNTEMLREELTSRGYLSSADPSKFDANEVVLNVPTNERSDVIYVDSVDRDGEEKINIMKDIDDGKYHIKFGADPATGDASAIVIEISEGIFRKKAWIEAMVAVADGEVVEGSSSELECSDKCEDCCGFWDCNAKRKAEWRDIDECGCISGAGVNIPGMCCDASCAGWPCMC